MFFINEKSEEKTKLFHNHINNGNAKIVNLLNDSDNENSKFPTKKWYVINSESKGNYSQPDPITFLTKWIELSLCDYSDVYILVTGNITIIRTITRDHVQRKQSLTAVTQMVFKNCAPFKKYSTEIDGTLVD